MLIKYKNGFLFFDNVEEFLDVDILFVRIIVMFVYLFWDFNVDRFVSFFLRRFWFICIYGGLFGWLYVDWLLLVKILIVMLVLLRCVWIIL